LPVAVKLALVAPAETVVAEGTLTAELLLESVMFAPPAVAAFVSVTVQFAVAPVSRDAGVQTREDTTVWVVTVRVADCDEPL